MSINLKTRGATELWVSATLMCKLVCLVVKINKLAIKVRIGGEAMSGLFNAVQHLWLDINSSLKITQELLKIISLICGLLGVEATLGAGLQHNVTKAHRCSRGDAPSSNLGVALEEQVGDLSTLSLSELRELDLVNLTSSIVPTASWHGFEDKEATTESIHVPSPCGTSRVLIGGEIHIR
jgi:hypothetical protein